MNVLGFMKTGKDTKGITGIDYVRSITVSRRNFCSLSEEIVL